MVRRRLAAAGGLGLASVFAFCVLEAQDGARSTRDGVFSAAQVARGERIFGSICANCHEIAEFVGEGAYLEEVEGKPLWDTFEFVWSEMPEDDPSSLDPADYAAVLSYIFSVYGLPTGEADLPIERDPLRAITIMRPANVERGSD